MQRIPLYILLTLYFLVSPRQFKCQHKHQRKLYHYCPPSHTLERLHHILSETRTQQTPALGREES